MASSSLSFLSTDRTDSHSIMPICDSFDSLDSWGLLLSELIDSSWFWFIEEFPIDIMFSFDFYIEFDS